MKAHRKYLFITVISSFLLAGCSTPLHSTKWEYKVALLPGAFGGPSGGPEEAREKQQAFLNELGKDGWVLISQNEGRVFYFMRAIK
jgi:hypothetical protein